MEARRLGITEEDEVRLRAGVRGEVMREVRAMIFDREKRWRKLAAYYKERGDKELARLYRIEARTANHLLAQLPKQ